MGTARGGGRERENCFFPAALYNLNTLRYCCCCLYEESAGKQNQSSRSIGFLKSRSCFGTLWIGDARHECVHKSTDWYSSASTASCDRVIKTSLLNCHVHRCNVEGGEILGESTPSDVRSFYSESLSAVGWQFSGRVLAGILWEPICICTNIGIPAHPRAIFSDGFIFRTPVRWAMFLGHL